MPSACDVTARRSNNAALERVAERHFRVYQPGVSLLFVCSYSNEQMIRRSKEEEEAGGNSQL